MMKYMRNVIYTFIMLYAGLLSNQAIIASDSEPGMPLKVSRQDRGCWGRIKRVGLVIALGVLATKLQSRSEYRAAHEVWQDTNFDLDKPLKTNCYQFTGIMQVEPYSTFKDPKVYCPMSDPNFYARAALHHADKDALQKWNPEYEYGVRYAECPDRCKVKKD